MKRIIEAMALSPLFSGLGLSELEELAVRFHLSLRTYERGELVICQGEKAKGIGLVVSGRLHIVRDDFLGNREILTEVEKGDIFDEVFAVLREEPQNVSAEADRRSEVAFLPAEELFSASIKGEKLLLQVTGNMFRVMAEKNLLLTRKMAHLSRRTIREKLISYFSEESSRQGSFTIDIPFNRQQLADYLAVERSALSRELSRMREDGLIRYRKNHFTLYHHRER